jgi:hypothetical protein
VSVSSEGQTILEKLKEMCVRMDVLCDFSVGIQAYDKYAGQAQSVITNRVYHSNRKKNKTYIQELNGNDIGRYSSKWDGRSWISYGDWLAHPRQPKFFEGPRILVREITGTGKHKIFGAKVTQKYINYKTILNIILIQRTMDQGYLLEYFLGVLNSSLMSFYFENSSNKIVTNTFPRISILDMKGFPIRKINFSEEAEKAKHDHIVSLVEQMLKAKEELAAAKLDSDVQRLEHRCATLDRQIDEAVYELYGLTSEEIAIVEGKN